MDVLTWYKCAFVLKGDSCGVCQTTVSEVGSGPSTIKVAGEQGPPGPPGPPGEGVEGKQVSMTVLHTVLVYFFFYLRSLKHIDLALNRGHQVFKVSKERK